LHAGRPHKILAFGNNPPPQKRGVLSHVTLFLNFAPIIFIIGEAKKLKHFKLRAMIDTEKYVCMRDILLPKGMCSESCDLHKFWEVITYLGNGAR